MHPKKPWEWTLRDAVFTKDKGKVFSCFACGGGSTMGYKLAGFDVIGANEIDPRMAKAYAKNHKPKYMFVEPIQTFKDRKDLPEELYNLDILDGSPPCSSFSMAGAREKQWGVKKKFREGQVSQVLDTLFFDFIDLAKRLQPKVVIAENVTGILAGKAKAYTQKIIDEFDKAGYSCSYVVLNTQDLGIPQHRKRVFFYAVRKDLAYPNSGLTKKPLLDFGLQKHPILFGDIYVHDSVTKKLKKGTMFTYWKYRKPSDTSFGTITQREYGKATGFSRPLISKRRVCPCITATGPGILMDKYRILGKEEACSAGTFPQDYDFCGNQYLYIIGMSVPPYMTRYVAQEVYKQVLLPNKDKGWPTYKDQVAGHQVRSIVWSARNPTWITRNVKWTRSRR